MSGFANDWWLSCLTVTQPGWRVVSNYVGFFSLFPFFFKAPHITLINCIFFLKKIYVVLKFFFNEAEKGNRWEKVEEAICVSRNNII